MALEQLNFQSDRFTPEQAAMALYNFGVECLKMKPYPQLTLGLDNLNEALSWEKAAGKQFPEIHAAKGEALLQLGKYEESVESFTVAINGLYDTNIKKAFCYFSQSKALEVLERHEEALASAKLAITLQPKIEAFYPQIAKLMLACRNELGYGTSSDTESSDGEPISPSTKVKFSFAKAAWKKLSAISLLKKKAGYSYLDDSEDGSDEENDDGISSCSSPSSVEDMQFESAIDSILMLGASRDSNASDADC